MKIVSNLRSNTCTIIHGFHKCCKCILLSTTKCMSTCVCEIQNYMNMQRFVQIETCSWIQTFSFVLVYQNLQQWRCAFVEQAARVHSLVSLSQSYLINLDFETFFVAFFSISQPTHKQLPMNQLESVKFRIAWMCSFVQIDNYILEMQTCTNRDILIQNISFVFTNVSLFEQMCLNLKCNLFLWWQSWIINSHYSSL